MTRYVIEGEWSGYTSAQQRVVHREVATKKRADAARAIHKIVYTDGTYLFLHVREALPREQVRVVNSYGSLISDAIAHGNGKSVVSVLDLP